MQNAAGHNEHIWLPDNIKSYCSNREVKMLTFYWTNEAVSVHKIISTMSFYFFYEHKMKYDNSEIRFGRLLGSQWEQERKRKQVLSRHWAVVLWCLKKMNNDSTCIVLFMIYEF